jgi:hypothetical protein
MLQIPKTDSRVGVPPAFQERCVVRCTGKKSGQSKKGKPMITLDWELIGYFDNDGKLQTSMKRGNTTYKLAGVRANSSYFTLTPEAVSFYADFYKAANPGEELTELDEENPNIDYCDGLMMQAVLYGSNVAMRKQLTEEEKKEKVEKGEEPVGDVITDEDGKPIEVANLKVNRFLKKYTGEVPDEAGPY